MSCLTPSSLFFLRASILFSRDWPRLALERDLGPNPLTLLEVPLLLALLANRYCKASCCLAKSFASIDSLCKRYSLSSSNTFWAGLLSIMTGSGFNGCSPLILCLMCISLATDLEFIIQLSLSRRCRPWEPREVDFRIALIDCRRGRYCSFAGSSWFSCLT